MKKKLLSLVLLLLAGITAAHAYDFSAVASTGQTLYYKYSGSRAVSLVGGSNPTGSLTIPSSVTYGGISYSVADISNYAFQGFSGLTSVSIPNSVTTIGNYAFQNCSGLTSVSIPNSVNSIGYNAFAYCSGLTSVSIPNSVNSIGTYAFSHCTGLTSVSIPHSITSIGPSTFEYCTGLTTITFPNSVTSIGNYAFQYCTSLTTITFPNSVSSIGNYAFQNCSGLTSITSKRTIAPTRSTNSFLGIPSTIPIYIPCGSTSSYTSSWANFSNFNEVPNARISVSSSNTTMGTARVVTQPTCTSSTATVSATPRSGYAFLNWTVSNTVVSTSPTYTFTATADRTLKANFTYAGNCDITNSDLPYTDNFDSYTTSTTAKTGVQPPCWTLAHQDVSMTDAYKPMIYYDNSIAHSGNYSLILNKRCIYAMPYVTMDVNRLKLTFYLRQTQEKYQLQVGVMSNLSDASTFVPVATLNNSSTTSSVFQTVNFDTYTGLGHYIAFRNILAPGNTGDYSCNYIDNITLAVNTTACTLQVSSLPYTDNFNSYTNSTTAKTGVEPPCWTLTHQDVTMSDEYKPMIYYSSANAHSGNYSLILNKRGIYAMPYINGSVNNLQLSMYVKQTQTKYQLQVGVMTNLNNASTFTPIATINNSGTGYVLHTISFSSYTGSGRYIAFRNTLTPGNTGDFSINYIDDLTLSNPSTYTITATANPTAGGTVTGGGTYNSGATCTLRATAASGYVFTNWTSGTTVLSSNATYSFTVNSNKTIKANFTRRYTITASANPSTGGTVTGGGTFNSGATCTLRATPNANYTFTNWTSGSTVLSSNPTYSFTVSANKTIKGNFTYIGDCSIDDNNLPYFDNFDSYTTSTTAKTGYTLPCWTLASQDVSMSNEYKPMIYYGSDYAHSGNYSLILNKRCIYAMPRVAMDVNRLKLTFYVRQTQAKYRLQVGVMSNLNDASTFVPVTTINNSSTTESTFQTVDFSTYTGLGHYIAFRNVLAPGNTGDYSCNYIDNINLSVNTSACTLSVASLPYTENFDSYTSSTTAKTGIEPPCWNLAHQDVTMADEYKPMIYYASANAHSGNYSLILNKRGIYTMPYINGSIRNLQLSMYVKQPQTKYVLQVGVMTNLNNASTFTPVATINNSGTGHVLHTVSFSSYTGSGRYIAFRNILASGNTGDFSINYIDDLTLSNTASYTITATANPTAGGSVTGAGTFTSGSTCTLRAIPNTNYTFTNWTSGSTVVSTNATYSFTVTSNRTLKANFSYTPSCQIQPSSLPYFDNFNSYTSSTNAKTGVEPACWTLAHQDVTMTDEYKPMIYYSSANAHSGNYSLILNKRGIYVMPRYTGDVSALQVSFYLKQTKSTYGLIVGVMSDLSNPSTFVPVATLYNSSTTAIEHYVVDFSSYTGNGHYIAFRNINSAVSDFSCNFIDDLTLSLSTSSCVIHTADMPYSDNFDSYTTSTTAKTGVEPTCWTLVHQDVAMTDEYKPMIYYSSANAHSGNYSLILNKRGIYAMPPVNCDVSTLQISMYVKQSMTKYQLQVGVMTNLSDASTFVPVTTIDNGSTASEHVTVSFARYTGNGRYIAFRNVLASGYSGEYSCNYIDDLNLSVRCAIHNSELPWIEGFENHTTSTTAKTGVEPACWTLVHQDVSMTTEYKPMVYYESSCAHSGNYSLILNKRCLYALPTVIANVNTLQMELYVRQTQTKYQL